MKLQNRQKSVRLMLFTVMVNNLEQTVKNVKHPSLIMDHVCLWMLFNRLWSACLHTVQIITHMFHKIPGSKEKNKTCAWLAICEIPELPNSADSTSSWPNTNLFPLKASSTQGWSPMPLPWPMLKRKNLKEENSQHFKIRVDDDAPSQESKWCPAFLHLTLLSIESEDELQIKQSSPCLERILGFIMSKGLQQLALRGSRLK